jgi:hypothetical protein
VRLLGNSNASIPAPPPGKRAAPVRVIARITSSRSPVADPTQLRTCNGRPSWHTRPLPAPLMQCARLAVTANHDDSRVLCDRLGPRAPRISPALSNRRRSYWRYHGRMLGAAPWRLPRRASPPHWPFHRGQLEGDGFELPVPRVLEPSQFIRLLDTAFGGSARPPLRIPAPLGRVPIWPAPPER